MQRDDTREVARFWNAAAHDFDAIYSGRKGMLGRFLDRCLRWDIYERFQWVMERAGDLRGATVCDIGCGPGRFVSALAARGAARVIGVDIAGDMLQLANQLVTREGVAERCDFVHSDVLTWDTNEQFDLTLAIGFWDYIADPLPRLRAIRRFTRGRFLSAWPRLWTWRMPIRKVRLSILGCPVYFFQRAQVYRYLELSGFRVERCAVIGQLYCVEAHPI